VKATLKVQGTIMNSSAAVAMESRREQAILIGGRDSGIHTEIRGKTRLRLARQVGLAAFLLLSMRVGLNAGDWPQILGPARNGIAADDEKLASRWPRGGPPTIWERSVGRGYAGLAVVGDRAVLFHRIADEEVIEILDASTGKSLSKDASPTSFEPQVGDADGPLCVPTIDQGRVVTFGAQGLLTCLDFSTGKRLWQRETQKDFQAPEGYFGAGSSPLVVENCVVVNVGAGRQGAGVVGFDLETGKTLWKQTDALASYSAPVSVKIEDLNLVLMLTRFSCLLLDPKSGTVLFEFPFGARGPTVNAATPLVLGDRLLVTASYGVGTAYAQFDPFGFRMLWQDEGPLSTQYCTPIHRAGFLYAIDGRDDVPPADLKCLDLSALRPKFREETDAPRVAQNASVLRWSEQNFGYGTLLWADGKLLAQKTDGEMWLLEASPDRLKKISHCRPFRGEVRALPALSAGRLYVRGEDTVKCLNLAPGL
jgi:outer membrane protein assembly factor BamB